MRKTWEAAVRLSPTPPALSDRSMMVGLSAASFWNSRMTSVLLFWLQEPSKRTKLKPCSLVKREDIRANIARAVCGTSKAAFTRLTLVAFLGKWGSAWTGRWPNTWFCHLHTAAWADFPSALEPKKTHLVSNDKEASDKWISLWYLWARPPFFWGYTCVFFHFFRWNLHQFIGLDLTPAERTAGFFLNTENMRTEKGLLFHVSEDYTAAWSHIRSTCSLLMTWVMHGRQ